MNVGGAESHEYSRPGARLRPAVQYGHPQFDGTESETAWINSTAQAQQLFGPPIVPPETMIDWTADWIERAMPAYAKPTHYEVRDGKF